MTGKNARKRDRKKSNLKAHKRKLPFWERITVDLLEMPRPARLFVSAFFALAVTLALSPFIDAVYLDYFFDERTVIVPALVAGAFGLVMYIAGYLLIIGWQGEDMKPRRAVMWYVRVGLLAIFVTILWIIYVLIV